jgi:REP element-mobilizing transposase RayT
VFVIEAGANSFAIGSSPIIEMEVDKDHIHLLVQYNPLKAF